MNLDSALKAWFEANGSLNAFWLERPQGNKRCVVYRAISPGYVDTNLVKPSIRSDVYSFSIYHDQPDQGADYAEWLMQSFNDFSGDLSGLNIQLIEFQSGFDQVLTDDPGIKVYQFNRDFTFKY